MSRRNVRNRWTVEVLRSERIGDACRVLLLTMALEMAEEGTVSVERKTLAAALNRHPQRISERIAEAKRANLLDQTGGGYRGRAATYVAVLPAGKVTGERSPLAGKVTGERYALAVTIPRSAAAESERVPIRESSVSVSEHLAVNEGREPRDDHDGSRDSLDHVLLERRSNEKQAGTQLPVDAPFGPWEPTRPIGPIVVHGDWSSVTRARRAAA